MVSAPARDLRYVLARSMSIYLHQCGNRTFVPGPGSYALDSMNGGHKCVFGTSPRDSSYLIYKPGPSPASYNTMSEKPHSPSFSFAARHASASRSLSPGPTTYRIVPPTETPVWSFGGSQRTDIARGTRGPGPASYDTCGSMARGPSYSLRSRTKILSESPSAVPGPDTYGGLYTQFD